jgi:hypothetical protein
MLQLHGAAFITDLTILREGQDKGLSAFTPCYGASGAKELK